MADKNPMCPVCGYPLTEQWSWERSESTGDGTYYECYRCYNTKHGLGTGYMDAMQAFIKAREEYKKNPKTKVKYFYTGDFKRYEKFKPGDDLDDYGDG